MGLAYTFSKTMKFISGELMMFSTCKLHLQCPSNIYASFKAGRRIDFTSKNYIKRWKLSRACFSNLDLMKHYNTANK